MFPLSTVLFPGQPLALHVFEQRYRAMVADCLAGERGFGVVLISRGSEVGGGDQRVGVGTFAVIEVARPLTDGRWGLLARGSTRFEVVSWVAEDPYPQAVVEELAETVLSPSEAGLHDASTAVVRARALLSELGEDMSRGSAEDSVDSVDHSSPSERVWRLCAAAPLPESDRQRLLEAADHDARLALLCRLCGELADDVAGYLGRSP